MKQLNNLKILIILELVLTNELEHTNIIINY